MEAVVEMAQKQALEVRPGTAMFNAAHGIAINWTQGNHNSMTYAPQGAAMEQQEAIQIMLHEEGSIQCCWLHSKLEPDINEHLTKYCNVALVQQESSPRHAE